MVVVFDYASKQEMHDFELHQGSSDTFQFVYQVIEVTLKFFPSKHQFVEKLLTVVKCMFIEYDT